MDQRYQIPEVASLATHDFLSSLSEHHLHYKVILVWTDITHYTEDAFTKSTLAHFDNH